MAKKNTPKYSFETIDQVLSDIKQKKGLEAPTKTASLTSSSSVLPKTDINSVLKYGGGNPNKAIRIADYNVPLESVYDRLNDGTYAAKFENYLGAEGNENRLALQQSGAEQVGKGLLKNTIKVGNYAFDSVIGTAYGLAKSIGSGQLRDLYDNELTNKLDDMNKKLDYALPNYYSDEQKSMGWLRSMGTANFWANDVAGGLAFVGGALLPQIAIGIATGGASTPALGATLAKLGGKLALKAGKEVAEEAAKATLRSGIKSSLDDGLKAMGSVSQKLGNATGYTKGKNVIKSYQQAILGDKLGTFANTTGFLARSAGFEAGMESRQALKESTDNYYQQFQKQNGRMPSFEENQAFMNDAVKASNKVFGANMAILTLSNAVMYGKKILPESTSNWLNKTVGGKVNNIIGLGTKSAVADGKLTYTMLGANRAQKIAGKTYKTLSKPLVEGLYEEGLQGVASKTMKNYLDSKYDKNNLDGYSLWGSLNDSFAEQYGTDEGWKEMVIGMVIGFAGGAITPGAVKNGYAFSGFGKNSYTSRRADIESNIKRANDGIELLSNLNRTSAAVAKEAAMKSGNTSDFLGAEDSLSHYNFIRSQESINSYSQMKNDYNVVIDNLQFEDESLSAIESAGLDIDSYKTKLKDDFSKSLSTYQFSKKSIEALGLNNKLKDTPGNIAEISDALMFGLMTGKDSLENARNIGSQIDSIIGTEGIFNHLNFYNSLEQDKKDQFLEYSDKKKNLAELQDAAARVAQKIGKINSTGQLTPELTENRRKRLSEQAVSIQDSIVSNQQRINELDEILKTDFRNTKYNLASETMDSFETVEDVAGAVENIDKIDNLIQSFDKSGKRQEADTLRYLVNQFKISADSHREMINSHRKMMDTNYFSSKEGKGFLKSILGDKFTMTDDLKKLIQDNDAIIDKSLSLNGIRDYEIVQTKLEEVIANNDQLSDREKFRLESLIRISLSKDAYEKAVEDLQSTSKQMQTRMATGTTELATKSEDLRRINLTAEGLNNISLIDNAINEITKELDYIVNYSAKNAEKIKALEEELENLRQQREDIIENNKNKQPSPETTSTTVTTTDTKRQEAESVMSSNLSYNDKISKLVELGLLTTVTLNGNKTNTAVYNGRLIHFMNLNGTVLPIYRSSNGTSGKAQGGWYPFFGFGNLYEEATFNDVNNTALGTKKTGKVAGFGDQGWLIKGTGSGEVTYNYEQGHGIEGIQYMQGLFNKNVTFSVSAVANKKEFESKGFTTDSTEQIDTSDRSVLDFNKSIFGQENLGVYNGDSLTRNQNSKFPLETIGNITSPITSKEWIKSVVDKLNETTTTTNTNQTDIEARINITPEHREILNMLPNYSKVKISIENDRGGLGYVGDFNERESELDKTSRMSTTIKYSGLPSSEIYTHELLHYFTIPALLQYKQGNVVGNIKTYVEGLNTLYQKAKSLGYSPINGVSIHDNLNEFAVNITNTNSVENLKQIGIYSDLIQLTQNYLESLTNPVQQNAPFSAPEQTVSTEQEEIEKKIADLEKQIDELKRPFKIIESPEYIRYYELAAKAEKETLTDAETEELNELRTDIDQWTLITGVVVDGFRLSDLLLQKAVLESTPIEKLNDIEIPSSEDTLDDETFADVTTRANYSFGLVYDKVFASKSDDLITIHNINAKSLEDILGKDFMATNNIVLEQDPTGKDNVVLTQESVDSINKNSNLRVRNTERNMLTNYSVVLERVVGLDGKVTYKPLKSAFSEEFNNGDGHDIQAVFDAEIGNEVEITTDLDNVYNIRIINEYKEALNEYGSRATKSEQDRIELEKAYNKLVSKLNMQAKINGKVVSTMKGLNKTVQDKNSDNVYVAFRNNIFSDPDQFKAILTGSGEYTVKITNNAGELTKPKITVSQVLLGHPSYNYVETADGMLATEFKQLSDIEAKSVVDVGYAVGTKTFTRDNQTVNTMFLKKIMNKKSTNKIPFIVLNVGGKRVAYPVKVASYGQVEVSEFEAIYNNKSADPVTKANALNRMLAKNGIDIKIPGNSFVGFFDNNLNDSFFQEKLAQLKNVNYFYNVDEWLDLNIDLIDIVKTQISVDIDVLNPFHSPKLSFSYSGLDMKDFVPPKKGKTKKKTASKSKNVEVNLAELFNKKNCQ